MTKCIRLLTALVFVARAGVASPGYSLVGEWNGFFRGQPVRQGEQNANEVRESRTPFVLHVGTAGRKLGGYVLIKTPSGSFLRRPLLNVGRFDRMVCFDVVNGKDMRWCVVASGSKLEGSWSEGPTTPGFFPRGGGMRIFGIDGVRLRR